MFHFPCGEVKVGVASRRRRSPACPGLPGTPDLHQTLPDLILHPTCALFAFISMFLLHMASSVWQTHQAMDGTGRAKSENCCSRTGDHIFYQIGGTVNDGNLNLSIEMRRSQTWTCRHGTPIHPTFPPGAATLQARRLRDTILCRSCSQNDQSRWLLYYTRVDCSCW